MTFCEPWKRWATAAKVESKCVLRDAYSGTLSCQSGQSPSELEGSGLSFFSRRFVNRCIVLSNNPFKKAKVAFPLVGRSASPETRAGPGQGCEPCATGMQKRGATST